MRGRCIEALLTGCGRVGARYGDVVRMTAVVRARTPAAVAAVDQRRLVAVTKQPVKPHAPAARAEVVADGVTVLAIPQQHGVAYWQCV